MPCQRAIPTSPATTAAASRGPVSGSGAPRNGLPSRRSSRTPVPSRTARTCGPGPAGGAVSGVGRSSGVGPPPGPDRSTACSSASRPGPLPSRESVAAGRASAESATGWTVAGSGTQPAGSTRVRAGWTARAVSRSPGSGAAPGRGSVVNSVPATAAPLP